jgi:peptidyl-prolyl cis-trans isomerase SurA
MLAAAGLGVCAVLTACGQVQMGAAAIVGDQRLTTSALDTHVSNLQTALKPYGTSLPITTAQMPAEVLSWMIRFQVTDEVAAAHGITVTDAQAAAGRDSLTAVAQQNGFKDYQQLLLANGVPPEMFLQVGRWEAQQDAFARQMNGGKELTTTAQQNAFTTAYTKAQCQAAKSLNIKVSPQYGRLDYTNLSVVTAPDTLSRPVPTGSPSPENTQGLVPAC